MTPTVTLISPRSFGDQKLRTVTLAITAAVFGQTIPGAGRGPILFRGPHRGRSPRRRRTARRVGNYSLRWGI